MKTYKEESKYNTVGQYQMKTYKEESIYNPVGQ